MNIFYNERTKKLTIKQKEKKNYAGKNSERGIDYPCAQP